MSTLETFVATQLFMFLIIFARIGSAMMIMPGFGDTTVPTPVRLYMALTMSFILIPFLQNFMPGTIPTQPIAFMLLVIREVLVGIFMGLMTQVMMNAINLAGFLSAHATSLSSAFTFNPQEASQNIVISSFFSLLMVTLIFVSDLHHVLLMGVVESYRMFPMTGDLMWGDMAFTIAAAIGEALKIGLMIATPMMVVSFGVFLAMGLVARLVPQIQVFVLSIPVQVMTGLMILMTSLSAMMLYFMQEYEAFWTHFLTS